jgi:3-oxoacyl-[acyl-carrier-protein] synthase III
MPLDLKVISLGSALPLHVVYSSDLETEWGLEPGWIARHTGVTERRWAMTETAPQLAGRAATQALSRAGLSTADIDCCISASASTHQVIPCTAVFVAAELGVPDGMWACFDVNATCLSFMLALEIAAALLHTQSYRRILVVSSEKSQFSLNPHEHESAALIGDAAAVAIVERGDGSGQLCATRLSSFPSGRALTEFRGGGTGFHPLDPATTRLDNQFHMDGPAVFRLATRQMEHWLPQFLADVGWSVDDVDILVPHQASLMAVRLLAARLGFSNDQVFLNIANRGNCIAASIPLALAEAVDSARLRRGMRVLLVGTAAGLTLGAQALVF